MYDMFGTNNAKKNLRKDTSIEYLIILKKAIFVDKSFIVKCNITTPAQYQNDEQFFAMLIYSTTRPYSTNGY